LEGAKQGGKKMGKPKKTKKRKKQFNVLTLSLGAEKYIKEQRPWLIEPDLTQKPQRRIYCNTDLFKKP